MSPQTKSAPSPSASRARATSRALSSMPVRRTPRAAAPSRRASGRAAPRPRRPRAGWRAGPGRSRCRARARRARSGRGSGDGERPGPSAACRARSGARSGRRGRYEALARSTSAGQARVAASSSWRRRRPSAGRVPSRGAGQGVGQGDRAQTGRGDALEQRRQHGEHHRLRRRRSAPHGRRAAAGCRPRPRPLAEPRQHAAPARAAPCRSRAGSSSPARGRAGRAPARGTGLRRPAGARKQRGATPTTIADPRLRRADLARQAARPEQREGVRVAVAVVLHAVAAAHDLAAERRMSRAAVEAITKKVARTPCASSRSRTAGVTSGSGPSSIVIAISCRAAAAVGQAGPVAAEPARARPESAAGQHQMVRGDRAERPRPGGGRRAARRRRRRRAPRHWP